jgi:hypothetical protein
MGIMYQLRHKTVDDIGSLVSQMIILGLTFHVVGHFWIKSLRVQRQISGRFAQWSVGDCVFFPGYLHGPQLGRCARYVHLQGNLELNKFEICREIITYDY